MKLGKTAARPYQLHLGDYLDHAKLPIIPLQFGHDLAVKSWGMLGNDMVGDCVVAGGFHETMLWNSETGVSVAVSQRCALETYSAITGYDPTQTAEDGSNPTDQGTDVQVAAQWRVDHGLVDDHGNTHKIAAFVAIKPNLAELYAAAYLFGAVGIGLQLPSSAQDQFDAGEPWTVVPGDSIEGLHYVSVVARRTDGIHVITWGREQVMTEQFFRTYCDEAVVYFSEEMLSGGVDLDGFDREQLVADLHALRRK